MVTLLKKNQGITLIEVLVVIAILGILASIAVPSYQDMIERNRLKQAVESLADD
jgi:type IV fimbrial biogenesis protein FimT